MNDEQIRRTFGRGLRSTYYAQPALFVAKEPGWCYRLTRGLVEFVSVYREYRAYHPRRYAARIAYDIAFHNLPF